MSNPEVITTRVGIVGGGREQVRQHHAGGSRDLLDQYRDRALQRIWKAQNFSYRMTSMLHERPDTNPFERKRQLGELNAVVNSRHGSAYLAEAYTGWPHA